MEKITHDCKRICTHMFFPLNFLFKTKYILFSKYPLSNYECIIYAGEHYIVENMSLTLGHIILHIPNTSLKILSDWNIQWTNENYTNQHTHPCWKSWHTWMKFFQICGTALASCRYQEVCLLQRDNLMVLFEHGNLSCILFNPPLLYYTYKLKYYADFHAVINNYKD